MPLEGSLLAFLPQASSYVPVLMPSAVVVEVTRVVPLLAVVPADRYLRYHGDATTKDPLLGTGVIWQAVK